MFFWKLKLKIRNYILNNGEEKGYRIFSTVKKIIILCMVVFNLILLLKSHFLGPFPTDNLRYFVTSIFYAYLNLTIGNIFLYVMAESFILMPLDSFLSDAVPEYYADEGSHLISSSDREKKKIIRESEKKKQEFENKKE